MESTIRIGVSACLLGRTVRWDGGHKKDRFLTECFGPWVEWVTFCPEVEVGMGTPREPVRLVQLDGATSLVGNRSGVDWTERMERHARERAAALRGLCGIVFKKDSPTCGLFRVKRYGEPGRAPIKDGQGLFARAFVEAHPLVPAEEEGRLNDPQLREAFVERVFAYRRLRDLLEEPASVGRLVAFHAAHKYQLLAHSTRRYTELGRLVAGARRDELEAIRATYARIFMEALAEPATVPRQVNVLTHVLGHFKRRLDPGDKREALELIDEYQRGLVPIVVPLTLLAHWVRRSGDEWLRSQTWLQPHPKELMLRNWV